MKVTIHRALSELKLIDAKIQKQILSIEPIGVHQKGKPINGHFVKDDFDSNAKSKYQSTIDLIDQKRKIKSAIVAMNAVTKLKVGKVEMTIADAITEKANVQLKKDLINHLKSKYNQALAFLNKNNETVKSNLQRILEASFGGGSKATQNDIDAISKPFNETNEFHLADPLGLLALIEKLESEVVSFEGEVDAALSEINAITFVEY